MYKTYFVVFFLLFATGNIFAQLTVSGTVYDSTKNIPVKNVLVKSTTGTHTITDSLGHYTIMVKKNDSLAFVFRDKSTPQFAVNQIEDLTDFDVSLHVRVFGKFKTLKEVRVISNTYKEDSMENREEYAEYFNYHKPGVRLSDDDGTAGIDLDQLINVFRFRRNKDLHFMQQRLEEDEQDKYVDYRFNRGLIKRITTIDSADIATFMVRYRPSFQFVQRASLADFYQYILDASYEFKGEKMRRDSLK